MTDSKITVTVGVATPTSTDVANGIDVCFGLDIDGVETAGEVTLLPHADGRPGYDAWGEGVDHWLDGETVLRIRDLDEDTRKAVLDAILSATAPEAENMEEPEPLTYKVFDADPNSAGGCEWSDTSSGPDATEYSDAADLAVDVLDWAVTECDGNSDYSVGDTLYVLVYRPDGTVLQDSRELELEDFTSSPNQVTDWEHVADFVSCCYGEQGDEPGSCVTEIGSTPNGVWYFREGGEEHKEVHGPFASREDAEQEALDFAEENDETPDEDELVEEILETGYFGEDADEEDIKAILKSATAHSQGYLMLPPGMVPCPVGTAWTTSGYLEGEYIQLNAGYDSQALAAAALLKEIQAVG